MAKFITYFGKSFMPLGKFIFLKMAKYKIIICPFGHAHNLVGTSCNKLFSITEDSLCPWTSVTRLGDF